MGWKSSEKISFSKPTRTVKSVFLHCSASDNPSHDSVATIEAWHIKRGFSGIGYHYFISKNGDIHNGRDIEKIPAAQKNHNTGSIAICLHGLKKEKFTNEQLTSVKKLCNAIDSSYGAKVIQFRGHCEVSNKSCPVFDYKATLQLDSDKHINKTISTSPTLIGDFVKTASNIFELFSTGSKIKEIQKALSNSGYPTQIDGVFGQSTKASVEAFQRANKLHVDGIVGPNTLNAMGTLKRGSSGRSVELLQKQLFVKGYKGLADGKFGVKTEANVKSYQTANRLKSDGIVGKQTKLKLFGFALAQKLA